MLIIWEMGCAGRVTKLVEKEGLIYREADLLMLTDRGLQVAQEPML